MSDYFSSGAYARDQKIRVQESESLTFKSNLIKELEKIQERCDCQMCACCDSWGTKIDDLMKKIR